METLNNLLKPEVLWIISGIVLLILEFATPGLVIFFFGIGAILTGAICFVFDPSFGLQLFIFLVSSLALLFSLRKWLKKVFYGRSGSEGEIDDITESYVGETAIVTKKITPDVPGQIELHGTSWKAQSDKTIKEGTPVKVVAKKNLVLTVQPISK